jgi:hypothetical protein
MLICVNRRSARVNLDVHASYIKSMKTAVSIPDEVTNAINRAVDGIGNQTDKFVAAASRRVLEKTEW